MPSCARTALAKCADPARFRAWLLAIVVNRCRSYAARAARRRLLLARWWQRDGATARTTQITEPDDSDRRIATVLAELSPALREAFLLKHVEEMSYEEMTKVTGASVSALKMRVKRAADLLAEKLSGVRDV